MMYDQVAAESVGGEKREQSDEDDDDMMMIFCEQTLTYVSSIPPSAEKENDKRAIDMTGE